MMMGWKHPRERGQTLRVWGTRKKRGKHKHNMLGRGNNSHAAAAWCLAIFS